MRRIRKIATLLVAYLILCSICLPAAANTTTSTQTVFLSDSFDTSSALGYGLAPSYLCPFIYLGSNPYPWIELDTSSCTVGKLYVYNKNTNTVTLISTDTATNYVATKDNLYYIADGETIVQTDYTGSAFSVLYTAPQGNIHCITAFGNILYFIEDKTRLIFLDTDTGNTQLVLTENDLISAFVFNSDKLIWYNGQNEVFYYNIATGQTTTLDNQYQTNTLIAQYTESDTDATEPVYSPNSTGTGTDNYNDIIFPLDEYNAVFGVENWEYLTVKSRFTTSYADSYQCDGFAKYAHDTFWHFATVGRNSPSWVVNGVNTADVYGSCANPFWVWRTDSYTVALDAGTYVNQKDAVAQFFRGLERGSFIRYGKANDKTPWDGAHSIVFDRISDDEAGIIVYEANQDGAGAVGYQKYYFGTIEEKYESIMYYVEHSLPSRATYEDNNYHTVECANCDGYLRQRHTMNLLPTGKYRCSGCGYTSNFTDNTIQSFRENHMA